MVCGLRDESQCVVAVECSTQCGADYCVLVTDRHTNLLGKRGQSDRVHTSVP